MKENSVELKKLPPPFTGGTYRLIRSSRKTIAVEITHEAEIIVRAPYRAPQRAVDYFLSEHADWIDAHLAKMKTRRNILAEKAIPPIDSREIRYLADKAAKEIPPRTEYYAHIIGVTYGRITIRNQTSVWGSCTARGNLNFNCLLMKMPPDVVDYVIIHELCHRKQMNHSALFWAEVAKYCPNYQEERKWLRDNGAVYIEAMNEGLRRKAL
jgi:predicted metal-dependent hydrolase